MSAVFKVLERYSSGQQDEADESVGLAFVRVEDVKAWRLDQQLLDSMTYHCKGGLRLLHLLFNNIE